MKAYLRKRARFARVLRLDLRRALLSRRFLAGTAFMLLWMVLNIGTDLIGSRDAWEAGIVSLLEAALGGYNLGPLILVIAAIPYSTAYLTEREWGFQAEVEKRTGLYLYSVSKAISTALSAFLMAALGILAFLLLLSWLNIPHFPPHTSAYYYRELCVTMGVPWYYGVKMALSGLVCALAGMFALWVSSYVPNAYAAVLAPMIGYYLWRCALNLLCSLFPALSSSAVWQMVSPINLFFAQVWLGGSLPSFLWTAFLLLFLTVCFGILFVKRASREGKR